MQQEAIEAFMIGVGFGLLALALGFGLGFYTCWRWYRANDAE